jgi:FeS assembly SUF system protein
MSMESERKPLEMVSPTAPEPPPTAPAPDVEAQVAEAARVQEIQEKVIDALRTCYDPEIPVNIHELGLIYGVDVTPAGAVTIRMTLTSPMCPAAGSLPPEVEAKARAVPGVSGAKVEVVWDPPWTPERMTEAAKLQLGLF